MNKFPSLLIGLFCISLFGCRYDVEKDKVVARTNSSVLYLQDVLSSMDIFESENDSIKNAQEIVNDWAREQLLYEQAIDELDLERKESIELNVERYKRRLYISQLRDMLFKEQYDTIITQEQKESYFVEKKLSLPLSHPIYRYRYLLFPSENVNSDEIAMRFQRFDSNDKEYLDSLSYLQFSRMNLNDSVWFDQNHLVSQISFLNNLTIDNYLKNNYLHTLEENGETHLFYISEKLEAGSQPPIEYIDQLLEHLIYNDRRIEFDKKLDNEIINQALQLDELQIY